MEEAAVQMQSRHRLLGVLAAVAADCLLHIEALRLEQVEIHQAQFHPKEIMAEMVLPALAASAVEVVVVVQVQ